MAGEEIACAPSGVTDGGQGPMLAVLEERERRRERERAEDQALWQRMVEQEEREAARQRMHDLERSQRADLKRAQNHAYNTAWWH